MQFLVITQAFHQYAVDAACDYHIFTALTNYKSGLHLLEAVRWVLAHEIASALRHEDRLADGHDQQYNKERKDRSAVPYGAGVYAPLRCSVAIHRGQLRTALKHVPGTQSVFETTPFQLHVHEKHEIYFTPNYTVITPPSWGHRIFLCTILFLSGSGQAVHSA
jgi:hypothetical protein